jgi:hypothetical protein
MGLRKSVGGCQYLLHQITGKWKQWVLPKRWYLTNKLHGVIYHKTVIMAILEIFNISNVRVEGLFMSRLLSHTNNTRTADVMHFIDSHSKYTTRSLRSADEMPTCNCRWLHDDFP